MSKKETNTKKKTASNTKKAANTAKKVSHNIEKVPATVRKAARDYRDVADNAVTPDNDAVSEYRVNLLPQGLIEDTIESLNSLMEDFRDIAENNLTSIQRRRKIGAGIKNYGFIEKVADMVEANPQYANFFTPADLRNAVRNLDGCRDIVLLLNSFARMVSNTMLVYSNEAFTMSLIYYNTVKEMARRGDPKAMELFSALQPFFRKSRRPSAEPTDKEIERSLHSLLHGKKDGKIVVENVKPKMSGGVHKVIEEKFNNTAAIKESAEGEIS